MIDLRKVLREEIYKLEIGDKFIDEFGIIQVVTSKEHRLNNELIFSYEKASQWDYFYYVI